MPVMGSKSGGHAAVFGSKATSMHNVKGQKNHGGGAMASSRSVHSVPSMRGIGDTTGGGKAAGNTANPVGNGQRDGQVRDYKLNTSGGASKVEKRKRGPDM